MNFKVVEITSDMCGIKVWFVKQDYIDVNSVLSAFEVYLELNDGNGKDASLFIEKYCEITGCKMYDSEDSEMYYDVLLNSKVDSIEFVTGWHYRF